MINDRERRVLFGLLIALALGSGAVYLGTTPSTGSSNVLYAILLGIGSAIGFWFALKGR
ncbi:MAG: LPXTG cell wall anchor domain-containing protein [Thaumarchaeota archaeon]|nr:LPXTG cell wall anchor domain-containing protein [Nitrososphaerota archaeon]